MPLLFILEKLNVQLLFGQKGCFRLNSLLPLSNRHTYYRIKTIYRIYYITTWQGGNSDAGLPNLASAHKRKQGKADTDRMVPYLA